MKKNKEQIQWRRLDNTAKLFPVIANENISHVFRISSTLLHEICPEYLQQALEDVLPWFDGFRVRLRRGVFWFYFEENTKKPLIEKESTYPCKYIDPHMNQNFLFRVSYHKNRINLEVFHAISDGLGAVMFLKELTYHYIDLVESKGELVYEHPSEECILDKEDSYVKNYRKRKKKKYSTKKAISLKGKRLYMDTISVMHGYVKMEDLKKICKEKNVSVTKYLVATLIWSIYEEYLNHQENKRPIAINLPVNLRSFFESTTTSNFFAISIIDFLATSEEHTFDEVLTEVSKQMDEKITKKRIEEVISYNVSAEKNWLIRILPLFLKNIGLGFVFRRSSKAATMTLSNLGKITVNPKYEGEVQKFHAMMGVFKRQEVKCTIISYQEDVVVTFTSVFEDAYLQKAFFRSLTKEGVRVSIESNGVVNEKV